MIIVRNFGDRNICVGGIGKMFYQDGFPISMAISELKKQNIEVSMLHIVEEFWNNGWSWETVEMKLRGELGLDIEKSMVIDFDYLHDFYNCLEQPKRKNGGYEESREMYFKYLFGCSTDEVRSGANKEPLELLKRVSNL